MTHLTRRQALQAGAGLAAWSILGGRQALAAPAFERQEPAIISQLPHRYHGWPTVARRKNGELLVVSSAGRESHVCPFGRVELMRSQDGGHSWTYPRVIRDGPIDDRDAGVLETAKGTLLVTTFSSLAYEPILAQAESAGNWPAEQLARWQAANNRLSPEERKEQLGVWMLRSTDGGISWSTPYRCEVNSPHGPIQLADGRLLYAGKELWHGEKRIGAAHSEDDGQTWQWLAAIPTREGDQPANYHELHAVETADGRLLAQIRNHNTANRLETLQTESEDGGKTWSVPHSIGVWGYPSHLLRLQDDRLLMTYGHRRAPIGWQARLSEDGGTSWSEPMVVYGDAVSTDMGYPSTVQLDDGSLVTVWYERVKSSPKAVLRAVSWQLT